MELRQLYRAILETLGHVVDESGRVFFASGDNLIPVTIKDEGNKHLVIPFDIVLRDPDWNTFVAFHPLSENVVRKDSSIFKWLQTASLLYLNGNLGWVMQQLIHYCSSADEQKKLNFKQNVFLTYFAKADEDSYKNWNKIQDKIGGGNLFVKVITLRDKKLNGEGYSRTTQITFPFYQECKRILDTNDTDRSIFGVKLRKKDIEGYVRLMEFVLKGIDAPDTNYSFGSRSMVAPSFHALINAVVRVARDIRSAACLLKLEDIQDLKWGDNVVSIDNYRGIVPPLAGNEGNITETERRQTVKEAQARPITPVTPPPVAPTPVQPQPQPVAPPPMQQPPVYQQPMPTYSAPSTTPAKGKMSMSQMLAPQTLPPVPAPAPVYGYQQPAPYAQPQYGYQQPVQGYPAPLPPRGSIQTVGAPVQPYGYPQNNRMAYGQQAPQYGYQQPVQGYGYPQQGYQQPMQGGWR